MGRYVIVCCFFGLIACGKVAQDISEQSDKSIFKSATLTFNMKSFEPYGWDSFPSTQNALDVYVYGKGLVFGKGYEKIGFSKATIGLEVVASKNVPVVTNYDKKKNIVTASRYQQGFIKVNVLPSDNYRITTEFKKIRPKYDYFTFIQYTSKNTFIFDLYENIPTQNIQFSPYRHLVSMIFSNHLKKESYNKETVIPLTVFYQILPEDSVASTMNIMIKNNVKKFRFNDPLFSFNSEYLDALMTVVNIAYYSDQFDVEDYISSVKDAVFSKRLKTSLISSTQAYFKQKSSANLAPTFNALESL